VHRRDVHETVAPGKNYGEPVLAHRNIFWMPHLVRIPIGKLHHERLTMGRKKRGTSPIDAAKRLGAQ
jgi:hypothetical protein